MSFYNDPRYFQKFKNDPKHKVRIGGGYRGEKDLNEAFDFFKNS